MDRSQTKMFLRKHFATNLTVVMRRGNVVRAIDTNFVTKATKDLPEPQTLTVWQHDVSGGWFEALAEGQA